MTGRGIGIMDDKGQVFDLVMTGDNAAKWLRGFAASVKIVDLDAPELLDALDKAQSTNVSGGRVYDYGHALAAAKSQAEATLTRNTNDFQGLGLKLEWP